MTRTFNTYHLSDDLKRALIEMGYTCPTEVQSKTIEAILNQRDLIVNAKTGSGKTAAFGIPIIEKLASNCNAPEAMIITPTRELAVQVNQELSKIAKYKQVKTTCVYGQHNIDKEINVLSKGVHIVTGTPGRIFDHLERQTLYTGEIKYLVLDEADRMLDMGFIDQVIKIIDYLPQQRVTLLFSATMPMGVQAVAWDYMKDPLTIEVASDTKTVDKIEQVYYRVEHDEKRKQLHRLLSVKKPVSCMVFCNTRRAVDRVTDFLKYKGYKADALHGALSQNRRLKTINAFKRNKFNVLVATDVAARGLHVDDLALVINYDLPEDKDAYIHRIGRTGRAGNKGHALSLVTANDILTLYEIEEHIGVLIEEVALPKYKDVYHASKTNRHKNHQRNKHDGVKARHISKKVYKGEQRRKDYKDVHTQSEIKKIVDAYNNKKSSKSILRRLLKWFKQKI